MGDSAYVKMTLSEEQGRVGDPVHLESYVTDRDFFPLSDGEVYAVVQFSGEVERVRLLPQSSGAGLYRGSFIPREAGTHSITAEVPVLGEEAAKTKLDFEVTAGSAEMDSIFPDHDVLEKIARTTGGGFYTAREAAGLVSGLFSPVDVRLRTTQYELWDSWPLLAVVLALVTTEWSLRKRWGMA